jgi:hypothetical protein
MHQLQMPEVNGSGLRIKQLEINYHQAAIMITGAMRKQPPTSWKLMRIFDHYG